MLFLDPPQFPDSAAALEGALRQGLRWMGLSDVNEPDQVIVEGTLPSLLKLAVTVTGATVDPTTLFTRKPVIKPVGVTAESFELSADPILISQIPASVAISIRCAAIGTIVAEDGRMLLAPSAAPEGGSLRIRLQREALEEALIRVGNPIAAQKNATLVSAHIRFDQPGPEVLRVTVSVAARVLFGEAKVTASTLVTVVADSGLRVSEVEVAGDGMLGGMAASILREKLLPCEGTLWPLQIPGLKTETLQMTADPGGIAIAAKFAPSNS
jgi:hypothetical protein